MNLREMRSIGGGSWEGARRNCDRDGLYKRRIFFQLKKRKMKICLIEGTGDLPLAAEKLAKNYNSENSLQNSNALRTFHWPCVS